MTDTFISHALKLVPDDAPKETPDLLRNLFGGLNERDKALIDAQAASKIALNHVELSRAKAKEGFALRIYTPCLDGEGWPLRNTIIDIVIDDMSFLVDSVAAAANRHGYLIHFLLHPVIGDSAHVHIQLQNIVAPESVSELEADLKQVLQDIRLANSDWKPMLAKLKQAGEKIVQTGQSCATDDCNEDKAFLDYIADNNFTLLGYQSWSYDENGEAALDTKSGLGVLGKGRPKPYIAGAREGLPEKRPKKNAPLIEIAKTRSKSNIHRAVPMDVIRVRHLDEKGVCLNEDVFLGLFTSSVYSKSVANIPYFRIKAQHVIESAGFSGGSHDQRALRHILEKYPRDELFQIDTDQLERNVLGILRLQERQKIALYTRDDRLGRTVSCLVYVPRDRFDTSVRKKFQRILEDGVGGDCNAYYTWIDDSVYARVLLIIDIGEKGKIEYDAASLEKELQQAGKTWAEHLEEALREELKNDWRATDFTAKYGHAFPGAYCETYQPAQAVHDISKIEKVLKTAALALELYQPEDGPEDSLRLKLYVPDACVTLSDVLPLLENMGLRVLSELPFRIKPEGADFSVWVHDFLLKFQQKSASFKLEDVKATAEEAFTKVWYGDVENDSLNKLVLSAGMSWREIMILRAYVRYIRQMRTAYSLRFIERTLSENPDIARMLVHMFLAYHDPENGDQGEIKAAGCGVEIDHALEKVASLDQDRILRLMLTLVTATIRTNFFQPDEQGQPKNYLSVKLDSRKIQELPDPKPFREIFVYAPEVEGIHLRGDVIARGGLRWSNRHEDFRTEVLGLMKAQMVKNAVIVPMGAKGGFVVKNPPKDGDRNAQREEGVRCYKLFISALLDITDNRVGEKIIPPQHVVRRDDDDPYLVVAADKGTATFSDIANTIAHQYGFWLGDAFASGGSTGYDHKEMGITARGAWESVKRHFREMNHDTQTQDFDVIGVGDMSGDVFGNGMILSEHIRLVGAFNHLHIFCDPDPEPAKSFQERKRLFKETAGWDAYDQKLLSKGGLIFSRDNKSLELTPEIKARFNIDRDRVTPFELIKFMLKARTDLLWFGGIGTYIKATQETHADVGDKANDPVRINANEIRARVVGEGANLAITQLGRTEYAQNGGAINTDFIDNAGGVDTSDHEVNLKILLNDVVAEKSHKMSVGARNRLLEEMTEHVAEKVLSHNYHQAMAISMAAMQSPENLPVQAEFIEDLEKNEGIRRELEGLPDEEELEKRKHRGQGLTRPELAVLLSYAKITFTKDLLASDIPDNPNMRVWLHNYFPERLQKKYGKEIDRHLLYREIIATTLADELVNRLGPTYVKSVMLRTGAACAEVAKAYVIAREAFNLRDIWRQIESHDHDVAANVQLQALRDTASLAHSGVNWLLTRMGRELDISADTEIFRKGVNALKAQIENFMTREMRQGIELRAKHARTEGLPEDLSLAIAYLPLYVSAFDIIQISTENETEIALTARTYFEVGEHFNIDWLRKKAHYLCADDRWTAEALGGLNDQLYSCQAGLTVRILNDVCSDRVCTDLSADSIVSSWISEHKHQARQLEPLFADMRRAASIDLPMLMIAEHKLRALYGG